MILPLNIMADPPLVTFAMIGFDGKLRQRIIDAVQTAPLSALIWRESAFSSADCWLVCGEKTQPAPSTPGTQITTLRVLAGLPTEHARTLTLSEVDRPLAFSFPLNADDIAPQLAFDPLSPKSVHAVLRQFQNYMKPTLARFVLGRQLTKREASLQAAVYHVTYKGNLLAVLDFSAWRMGILPSAEPVHLEQAMWEKRPTEARAIPQHFLPTDLAQLRWTYAKHARQDVLPARYQTELIYFRQSPSVPLGWLTDSHLLLLQELSIQPANVQTLAARTGLAVEQLKRDLASLYFAGSLTTTPSKAAIRNACSGGTSGDLSGEFDSYPDAKSARSWQAGTVSAQLR